MSQLLKEAHTMLDEIPEDKIIFLIEIMRGLKGLYSSPRKSSELSDAQKAYIELENFRKPSDVDRDYKEELAKVLEGKYENIG